MAQFVTQEGLLSLDQFRKMFELYTLTRGTANDIVIYHKALDHGYAFNCRDKQVSIEAAMQGKGIFIKSGLNRGEWVMPEDFSRVIPSVFSLLVGEL